MLSAMISVISADASKPTVSLMTEPLLGDFADDGWPGYACRFADWTACVNSTAVRCDDPRSACRRCTSKRSGRNESITCTRRLGASGRAARAPNVRAVRPPGRVLRGLQRRRLRQPDRHVPRRLRAGGLVREAGGRVLSVAAARRPDPVAAPGECGGNLLGWSTL